MELNIVEILKNHNAYTMVGGGVTMSHIEHLVSSRSKQIPNRKCDETDEYQKVVFKNKKTKKKDIPN